MKSLQQIGHAVQQPGVRLTTVIPVRIRRRGGRKQVLSAPSAASVVEHDTPLLTALARAFHWQRLLDEGRVKSGSEIARREGMHPTSVNELLRLTLLSPATVRAILAGQQPQALSLMWLKNTGPPLAWDEQHVLFARVDL
ncbi:MAG: hypothetical protein O2979_12195 [Proteobacteria bacterium]|nr:hypothetical protein [Pseudomonadota bacterium]